MMADEGTHEVTVSARNQMHDLLGAEAEVTLEVEGGHLLSPMSNRMFGQQTGMIQAAPGATEIGVDVYIDGEFFQHLGAPVSNPIPLPEEPEDVITDAPEDDITDDGPSDPGFDEADPEVIQPAPAPPADDGCGGAPLSAAPWWLLSSMGLFTIRRRARA